MWLPLYGTPEKPKDHQVLVKGMIAIVKAVRLLILVLEILVWYQAASYERKPGRCGALNTSNVPASICA